MFSAGPKRTRLRRVASLELPPGQWEQAWKSLRQRDVLGRIGMALFAAALLTALIQAWDLPFSYRIGFVPQRDVVARVPFTKPDPAATLLAQQRALRQVPYVFSNDAEPLIQLQAALRNAVAEVTAADSLAEVDPKLWKAFALPEGADAPGATPSQPEEPASTEQQFQKFREVFTGQENLKEFSASLEIVFEPLEDHGVLQTLPQELGQGNQVQIVVHPVGRDQALRVVDVSEVQLGDGTALRERLRIQFPEHQVADRLFGWVWPRLRDMKTLSLDKNATNEAKQKALAAVEQEFAHYVAGETLAEAGQPINDQKLDLLRREHTAAMAQRTPGQRVVRGMTVLAMIFALFILCGIYMRFRQRGPLARVRRLAATLSLVVASLAAAYALSADALRLELIPLMLFGMTAAIVYSQELSLLLSGVVALILVLGIGQGLHELLLMMGVTTVAILNIGQIRKRDKLIYIGLFAGGVAALLDIGLALIDNQPLSVHLLQSATRNGLCAVAAGFLVTGLLPFIERLFGVLTDLSLLVLGDVSHPLLQELIRRAPSTYNHSVTVGSIAEAAADSIGARGLLVRVGAYFHDIGKMLKPGYYVENQGEEANRHETLVPTMSSLVIVAHIKDGADLARQHHLPQPIIDLIEQHHGTTRVGFFYERASQQQQAADPKSGPVEESPFRYPGPRPQTKEAAVLMLADASESASRSLVDPTPARLERVVRDLAEQRLHGGQFDESGLTLRELRTIEKSLVKSLTSIYHGRLKYPDQKTA